MMRNYRKIDEGKVLWGVCGGIADMFGINRMWVRVPVLILGLYFGWPAIAIYLLVGFFSPDY